MGKYSASDRRRAIKAPDGPHPIWRGIGCLMMVIVPVISFGLAVITFDTALEKEWAIPREFLGNVQMPDFLYRSQVLVPLLNAITGVTNLYGYLAFTLLYVIVLGAILSFIYAFAYRFVGPPAYGPMDAPPPRSRGLKRYKR
jgi:hypothetical protein